MDRKIFTLPLLLIVSGCGDYTKTAAAPSNPIITENQLPGTDTWTIAMHSFSHQVEGYAGATSVTAGQALPVHVNVSRSGTVGWTVYRLGITRDTARAGSARAVR